ncbi:helicase-related protein [Paucilactobacillus hokkaidonensis]|uniref:helicase-related protein n=1 Tax=Paucilactobacillus hokkaidonensis TaxID=1193095 RepID=UPI000A741108|nr:helicase-related protein [Paucilactobacillus hokkaidonensis]
MKISLWRSKKSLNSADKRQQLLELVTQLVGPGVIYFSSRKQATQISQWLQEQTGLSVAAYHAGIDQTTRYKIQHQFMQNELQIICATSAFGMGIDKDDIRYVIHYHLCANLENYVQEIGRAGRDGRQSIAILLYSAGDEQIPRRLNQLTIPSQQVVEDFVAGQIKVEQLGDIGELLNFYVMAGWNAEQINQGFILRKQQENEQLMAMLQYINSNDCRRNLVLTYFDEVKIEHDQNCCDGKETKWSASSLGLQRTLSSDKQMQAASFDWHERLEQLFFWKILSIYEN